MICRPPGTPFALALRPAAGDAWITREPPAGALIVDSQGRPAPLGSVGRLRLHLPAGPRAADAASRADEDFLDTDFLDTGELARWRHDGSAVEWLGAAPGLLTWRGERLDLRRLAALLAEDPAVAEAAVLARRSASCREPVVYRVAGRRGAEGGLPPACRERRIESRALVAALPRTAEGAIDEEALAAVPVAGEREARLWQNALEASPGVREARVVARERPRPERHLHLSSLFGSAREDRQGSDLLASLDSLGVDLDGAAPPPALASGGPLEWPQGAARTLGEALLESARRFPEHGILCVQEDGGETRLSYPQLVERARRTLSGLRAAGLEPGDSVILQCDRLADHFTCFWACVLGGIVPLTVAIPAGYGERGAVVQKLWNVWLLLRGPHVLHSGALGEGLAGVPGLMAPEGAEFPWRQLRAEALVEHEPAEDLHRPAADEVVFRQLSSGSTGVPKCIQETHQGILHHVWGAAQENGYGPEDRSLNWLPLDHVVPTLTSHLKDVCLGIDQVHLKTQRVLASPLVWLERMERHRITHSWSPNFGFKLITDALHDRDPGEARRFDLSALRRVMNAGEQVTEPAVRGWLEAVAPSGVSDTVMQPAYGMAEVCTAVTYANGGFAGEAGVRRVVKESLGGLLRFADSGTPPEEIQTFIEVGPPIPGVELRIVDGENRQLPERVIGRLQIRGAAVTPGYLNNGEANAEAFVGDGWFRSGDLGFLDRGSLVITGREKEVIIIRGANFYCYEIEDAVAGVPGVAPTWCAAVAVDEAESGSETLAVFYVPENGVEGEIDAALTQSVRATVAREMGVSPGYVLPIRQEHFPKTTSGKIQRGQLKKRLAEGDFDALIRRLDLLLANERTVPAWFMEAVWRPVAAPAGQPAGSAPALILDSGSPLSDLLAARLEGSVVAVPGSEFRRLGERRFSVRPDAAEDLLRLLGSPGEGGGPGLAGILDLRGLEGEAAPEPEGLLAGTLAQARALAEARDAAGPAPGAPPPARLLTVARSSESVRGEGLEPALAARQALVAAAGEEMPGLAARHVDLEPGTSSESAGPRADEAAQILAEWAAPGSGRSAWRQGVRLEPRLETADPETADPETAPGADGDPAPAGLLRRGGSYLLTGGLGGIGRILARRLLEEFEARVLLVGRTAEDQLPAETASDLARLRATAARVGGELRYLSLDIASADLAGGEVERVLAGPLAKWRRTDAVFHLAGLFGGQPLRAVDGETLARELRPKIRGTRTLRHLLPESPLVLFGSVNAFFAGATAGVYGAGNRFLEAFAAAERAAGRPHVTFLGWSLWDEVGMTRGYLLKEAGRAQGFLPIAPEKGWISLRALLGRAGAEDALEDRYIGLDGGRPRVRGLLVDSEGEPAEELRGYLSAGEGLDPDALRSIEILDPFGTRLPCAVTRLESLPRREDGSVDDARLGGPEASAAGAEGARTTAASATERLVAAVWQDVLSLDAIDVERSFFELGGQSLLLVRVHSRLLELQVGPDDLTVVDLLRYPTVRSLARFLDRGRGSASGLRRRAEERASARLRRGDGGGDPAADGEWIAIVGMAGRFPQSPDVDAFWRHLEAGRELVSFFSREELEEAGVTGALIDTPGFVAARAVLEEVDRFDAGFFGINPREAENTDPQQRLFLETAWQALESAGYDPSRFPGSVGVFAGADANSYAVTNLLLGAEGLQTLIGNDKDYLASRVAYKLDLRGPALTVQTACSTSLVAVHLACRSLLDRDSDLALAGGVGVFFPQKSGYVFEEGGILSPDGRCRAFDARAKGTVGGDGVGAVALRRYGDAVADGDRILAVIRGSAINNDGAKKVGFTAPSVEGQSEVIALAQAAAGVPASSIGYVEAHGTGTQLGDPIEVAALTEAFRAGSDAEDPEGARCALGSLKSSVGHMNSAAGIGSLIKTVQALRHRRIPPSLHFESPNPRIDFASSPFYVAREAHDWPRGRDGDGGEAPRRAAVSSFGIGGTNAHVVLEEGPPGAARSDAPSRTAQLLPLSARSQSALGEASRRLASWLEEHPETPLADVAYTLQVGRKAFAQRRWVVAPSGARAAEALRLGGGEVMREPRSRQAVFLFPGQGSQFPGMGAGLYEREPAFRADIDRAGEILGPQLGLEIAELITAQADLETAAQMAETRITQPLLFALEVALGRWWLSVGVEPQAMLGHSVGEYAAACLAGVFSFEEGLALVAERGRLTQEQPRGVMLAVALGEAEARRVPGVTLATINGPRSTVVAGGEDAVRDAEIALAQRGVACRRLATSHAFHSPLLEGMAVPFRRVLADLRLEAPKRPFFSNVTGILITDAQATSPDYWVEHCLRPVRFAACLEELARRGEPALLEVGPGRTLITLARKHGAALRELPAAASVEAHAGRPDEEVLLGAVGELDSAGVAIEWRALHGGERRRRVGLPTYPFERESYFIDPRSKLESVFESKSLLYAKRDDPATWLYAPAWKREAAPRPPSEAPAADSTLVFYRPGGAGERIRDRLEKEARFGSVIDVVPGAGFERPAADAARSRYTLDPRDLASYERLVGDLLDHGQAPGRVIHLWQLDPSGPDPEASPSSAFELAQTEGFYSVLFLIQALGRSSRRPAATVDVVTRGALEVTGTETLRPEAATCLGLALSASQEYSDLDCRVVDCDDGDPGAERLLQVLASPLEEAALALRGRHVWRGSYESLGSLAGAAEPLLEPGGAYVITGGLGGIGLIFAEFLARDYGARLVLTGRTGVPARSEQDAWLASHGENDRVAVRIRRLRRLEEAGAEVLTLAADAGDASQMRAVFRQAKERFGRVAGVIHAAGHVGEGLLRPIAEVTLDQCQLHFHPKAHGLEVLAASLPEDLDFCLLTSSLAAVLGGIGGAAYAAANAFMDLWVRRRAQEQPEVRWLSVDWDAWLPHEGSPEAEGPTPAWARFAIEPEEGVEVLRRALALEGVPQLLVSTTDLDMRLQQIQPGEEGVEEDPMAEAEKRSRHSRPAQNNEYVAPRTEIEKALAELWQALLGIDRVGVLDNFFRLGGDSLVAIQLSTRLREAFGVELNVNQLFDEPTIAGLAEKLETLLAGGELAPPDPNRAAEAQAEAAGGGAVEAPERGDSGGEPSEQGVSLEALEAVENLSDEEVARMLAELEAEEL
ncbi:MAG: SDR family NAD(P)-dependent oxidoreductase, partial [Acidobacteriota bacterium]